MYKDIIAYINDMDIPYKKMVIENKLTHGKEICNQICLLKREEACIFADTSFRPSVKKNQDAYHNKYPKCTDEHIHC